MKVTLLLSLVLFSNIATADDFYSRYLVEAADCQTQARQTELMSAFFHCIVGALRTVEGDPWYDNPNEQADVNFLIELNTARAVAWEKFENFQITQTELNDTLGKLDRHE